MPMSWLITPEAQLFAAIVRAGSISGVAQQWRLCTDEVSRRLLHWQAALPAPLFCIQQDWLLLTLEGQQLYHSLCMLPDETPGK
ncbi:hypothetical protein BHU62_09285 [Serratia marcescens]|uniref:LysR family transcriptional regulator n=1 Tax=Serratia marcescens TaxID=615 RepID=A0A1Q4P165_SERMA|nr:LysR family transcriptional regulator [Serratia marcescens]OKB66826.1 hypothetical protein BHU62_09285 [Serratia marcescens]